MQVGINEQIHRRWSSCRAASTMAILCNRICGKVGFSALARPGISSAPIAGVVAIVITRCWCGLPVISSALRKASMPRLMY
nr:Uncharacterised protein [Klebsiella pneumoniae]